MNDGQADLMAEMKKMQETMLSILSLSGRSDNYGMIKEFIALQVEIKQMKEDQEKQKDEYKKVCENLEKQKIEMEKMKEAHEKALEDQKADNKKLCRDLRKQKEEVKQMREDQEVLKTEYKKVYRDLKERKVEKRQLKMDQEAQKIEKLCDELAELKTKQNQDVAEIREETTEMKKAYDLKFENHEARMIMLKMIPIEEQIAGKWKMVSSTGREEYEKNMINFDSHDDRSKISHDDRRFAFDRCTLSSYVDNDSTDTSLSKNYTTEDRVIKYTISSNFYLSKMSQDVEIYIKDNQLIVFAALYNDSELLAICECFYDRV